MRVTENTNFDVVRESVRRSKERLEGLQNQSATLKKLNAPSDDPIGAAKVLQMRTEKVNFDQYQMNSKMAETYLSSTDHALAEIGDLLIRAKEIAIGQSSGVSSNEETRLGVAEEVTQLYKQAVAVANLRVGDRYLFSGYKTHKPAVDGDGKYMGDDGQMMVEIGNDVFLAMNVTGAEAFNTNPSAALRKSPEDGYTQGQGRGPANESDHSDPMENVNVFDELQNFRIALLTGDLDGIRSTLERFDQIHSRVIATRAKVGSRLQGLQSTAAAIERHALTAAHLSSVLEDADMAQVMSSLAKEETVLQSSLKSSHKLIQPTLMDFLR